MPDYGVSGPTRRYALIVGMLVALATVPTLVVLAVGAAWVGDRHSGGTPPRGASTGDPVIVLSRPPAGPRVADNVAVPPVAPTTSPAPPQPAVAAVVALPPPPAPGRPITERAISGPATTTPASPPAPTTPAPTPSPTTSSPPTPSPTDSSPTDPSPTDPDPTDPDPTPTGPTATGPEPSGEPDSSPTPDPVGSVPESGSGCRDRWRDLPPEHVSTDDDGGKDDSAGH